MKNEKLKIQTGQAAIISVLFVMAVMLTASAGTASIALRETRIARENTSALKSFYTAEAAIEDIVYRFKRGKNVNVGSQSALALNNGQATVSITTISPTAYEIVSRGDVSYAVRASRVTMSLGEGIDFSFAMQAGSDGIGMGNTASIQGNVYSNGTIQGANGSVVTGNATVAGTNIALGNFYELSNPGLYADYMAGKQSPEIDVAQSFIPAATGTISQVSLYVKKVGSPTNRTVRIVPSAANGNPAASGISSGTLYANQITTSFGWINVPLSSTPTLNAGTTYWIVLDNSASASNYYILGLDATNGNTAQDASKYSSSWTSGSWISISGDLSYRAYMGGAINELRSMVVYGDARANTIINSEICGDAYYQTINNPSLSFLNNPTAPCAIPRTPGAGFIAEDQPIQAFPISDAQIEEWKLEAQNAGIYTGPCNLTDGIEIGPGRYDCDMTANNTVTVSVKTPIWVNGNIALSNGVKLLLDQSYGGRSGVIIADYPSDTTSKGTITTGNSFVGCGSGGYSSGQCSTYCDDLGCSYLMLLSTYGGGGKALSIANSAIGAIFYAPFGKFGVGNGVSVNAVTAKRISLANGASIRYETGLTSALFLHPQEGGASWNINSWREVIPPQ